MKTTLLLAALAGVAFGVPRPQDTPEEPAPEEPAPQEPTPEDPAPEEPSAIECAPFPDPLPSWEDYPTQSSLPDPFLPIQYMTTAGADGTTPADIMAGLGANRIQTPEEWYQCQQPQLMHLLQEFQFGYYPDHSLETVTATRSGDNVAISVEADGKTASFEATVALPSGEGPFPVVIAIGGGPQGYLQEGIAVADFNYVAVAADSNAKTGAFWDLYGDRDIGKRHSSLPPITLLAPRSNTIQASSQPGPGASTAFSTP